MKAVQRQSAIGEILQNSKEGAIVERMVFEFDFVARRQANHRAKQSIAAEAIKFIQSI